MVVLWSTADGRERIGDIGAEKGPTSKRTRGRERLAFLQHRGKTLRQCNSGTIFQGKSIEFHTYESVYTRGRK